MCMGCMRTCTVQPTCPSRNKLGAHPDLAAFAAWYSFAASATLANSAASSASSCAVGQLSNPSANAS